MTTYIRNSGGGVQSVPDALFATSGAAYGWTQITQAQAQAANPQLFGTADPAVTRVQMHDDPVQSSVPILPSAGATGYQGVLLTTLVGTPSNLIKGPPYVGHIDARQLDITADGAPITSVIDPAVIAAEAGA